MRVIILLLFLVFTSCHEIGSDIIHVIINDGNMIEYEFELKYGKSRILPNGLKIGFKELLGDSRCPTGAVCVWEGRADISLWMLKSRLDTISFKLSISGYVNKTNSDSHKYIDTLGYRIKLLQLDPYPVINIPRQPSDYNALLRVSQI